MNLLTYGNGIWGYGRSSNRHYRDFKSGDRVVLTHSFRDKANIGVMGTIHSGDGTCFYVDWDNNSQALNRTVGIVPHRIDLAKTDKKRQN